MKTITIRSIDDELSEKCKSLAKKEGKSINQFVLDILKERAGLKKNKNHTTVYNDMDHLFGIWSDADEYKKIQKKIDSERKIDEELWR